MPFVNNVWYPVSGTLALDINKDPYLDLLIVGNSFTTAVSEGPYDAMNGLVLLGNGDGTFRVTQPSGFYVPGDGKALVAILAEGQLRIIASQNNGKLKAFEFLDRIGIQTVKKEEQTAFIHFKDGSARRVEMNTAGGYLSLSSAFFTVPESAGRVTINNGENGKDRILQ